MVIGQNRVKARAPDSDMASRSFFGHYLPRLRREFYMADAVVFWTLTIHDRKTGWLDQQFHQSFRELMLHAAAREGLICPAYCLMPDHIHFVWMGLNVSTDQRSAMKFLRTYLAIALKPFTLQHQAYDRVLTEEDRIRSKFTLACVEYVLLNPWKAELVTKPEEWQFLGAMIPGYPDCHPFSPKYWPWFWQRYAEMKEDGVEQRKLPRREME